VTTEDDPSGSSSMMELFRIDVENQVAILTKVLLALEEGQASLEQLEALMRAAHSVKGAARVVGVDPLVALAHAMEDCFVAAQEGLLVIDSDKVDLFLCGVDILAGFGAVADDAIGSYLAGKSGPIAALAGAYQAMREGKPLPQRLTMPALVGGHKPEAAVEAVATDRVVRVTAGSLDRLMGLAGESLVGSRWLQPFSDGLLRLKRQQNSLADTIDLLREALKKGAVSEEVSHYLDEAHHRTDGCRQETVARLDELEGFIRRTVRLSDRLYREVINSRMRPFSDGVGAFPRMVRDLARQFNKKVNFNIVGSATPVDRDILEKLEAPLGHLLRNAVDHGIEAPDDRTAAGKGAEGSIVLEARHSAGMLAITLSDDGAGLDVERIRDKVVAKGFVNAAMAQNLSEQELLEFLFLPGFSTAKTVTDVSGRGVGLDIVQSMVQEVGGILRTTTSPGKGMTFHMQLPLTLSVIRALIVAVGGEPYAFPLTRIDRAVEVSYADVAVVEGRQYFHHEGQNVGIVPAFQVLELPEEKHSAEAFPVIIISDRMSSYGIAVDRILGEKELVVQRLDSRLGKVADVSAAALLESGEPVIILDVEDMVKSIDALLHGGRLQKLGMNADEAGKRAKRILVVDDSITVREVECRLLRNRGYDVDAAVDGIDGFNTARLGQYDLIVTDIDMPRMNGIDLVKALKADDNLKGIPVVIVSYKEREEERLRGLEAGADYYLTKSSFHDETLLKVVEELIGGSGG